MGLNPEVEKLDSGFRPGGNYIALLDLNPEVQKQQSGFRPRGKYLSIGGSNPYPEANNYFVGV